VGCSREKSEPERKSPPLVVKPKPIPPDESNLAKLPQPNPKKEEEFLRERERRREKIAGEERQFLKELGKVKKDFLFPGEVIRLETKEHLTPIPEFSKDGSFLASQFPEWITVWDLRTGKEHRKLPTEKMSIVQLNFMVQARFSPNGRQLISGMIPFEYGTSRRTRFLRPLGPKM
jgi:hypothetical protein